VYRFSIKFLYSSQLKIPNCKLGQKCTLGIELAANINSINFLKTDMKFIIDTLEKLKVTDFYFILAVTFMIYLGFMFVYPATQGGWDYLQAVWDRWQGLNVGILALFSSLLAFNISRANAENQREREFIAERAFLPDALSELHVYFKDCVKLLNEAFPRVIDDSDSCRTPLIEPLPDTPPTYRKVFQECIRHGEPDVSEFLALILSQLQIYFARLSSLKESFDPNRRTMVVKGNVLTYYYNTGELESMVNRVFPLARAEKELDTSELSLKELESAYRILGVTHSAESNLLEFTERVLSGKKGQPFL